MRVFRVRRWRGAEDGSGGEWTDNLVTWQSSTVVCPRGLEGWTDRLARVIQRGDMNGAFVSSRETRQKRKMQTKKHNQEWTVAATSVASTADVVQPSVQRWAALLAPCPFLVGNKRQLEPMIDRRRIADSLLTTAALFHNNRPTLCKNTSTTFS